MPIQSIMTENIDYVEACKVSEIAKGHMKHVEINGKEIAIANVRQILWFLWEGMEVHGIQFLPRMLKLRLEIV